MKYYHIVFFFFFSFPVYTKTVQHDDQLVSMTT